MIAFTFSLLHIVLGVLALLGVVIFIWHANMQIQRKGEPPVRWSWIPFMGFAIEMGTRPIELMQESANKLGEIYGLVVAGNRMFFINDPHSVGVLFRSTKDFSWIEFHNTILHNFFGTSKEQLENPNYDDDLMRKWFGIYMYRLALIYSIAFLILFSDNGLNKLNTRLLKRQEKDFKSNLAVGETGLFDFVSRLIFKASMASFLNDAAADDPTLYDTFLTFDKLLPICAAGVNLSYFKDAHKARELLLTAVSKYTDDNCELFTERRKYFKSIPNFKDRDMFTMQLAMFWASVGNTMYISFWIFYYLLKHPEQLSLAKKEITDAYDSIPKGSELDIEQINKMCFLDACITDLRLATGNLMMRYVRRPCEITLSSGNTYKLRKGDRIGVSPTTVHFDEEVYPQAQSFQPSRWLKGNTLEEKMISSQGKMPLYKGGKEIPSGYGFLTFGAGPTYCPGRRFARFEIKTILCLILSRYNLSLKDPNAIATLDCSRAGVGIFPPKDEVMMKITSLSN